jgi:hypothetical protein
VKLGALKDLRQKMAARAKRCVGDRKGLLEKERGARTVCGLDPRGCGRHVAQDHVERGMALPQFIHERPFKDIPPQDGDVSLEQMLDGLDVDGHHPPPEADNAAHELHPGPRRRPEVEDLVPRPNEAVPLLDFLELVDGSSQVAVLLGAVEIVVLKPV